MWEVMTSAWDVLSGDVGITFVLIMTAAGWVRSHWLKKIWKDNEEAFEWFFEITQENIPETSRAAEKWLNKPNKRNFEKLYAKLERWKDTMISSDKEDSQK